MANEQVQPVEEDRLESYVERLTVLQTKINDTRKEMSLITEDAKINGFDLQALQLLVNLRTQHRTDFGRRVLTNLTKYAHLSGVPLDVVIERQSLTPAESTSLLPDEEDSYEEEKKSKLTARVFVTAAWGVILAVSLLWLLT